MTSAKAEPKQQAVSERRLKMPLLGGSRSKEEAAAPKRKSAIFHIVRAIWQVGKQTAELVPKKYRYAVMVLLLLGYMIAALMGPRAVIGYTFYLFMLMGTTIVIMILQWLLVQAVVEGVKTFDRAFIGVDLDVKNVFLNIFTMRLSIHAFKVYNPEGYASPFFIVADEFTVDLDAWTIIKSLGPFLLKKGPLKVLITELALVGVQATIEHDRYLCGKSNVQWILDFMGDTKPSEKQAEAEAKEEPLNDVECVYQWWHTYNTEHVYHFAPARERERFMHGQFYAYTRQVEGTEPVYEFYNSWNYDTTVHFEPAWPGEEQRDVAFYAFRKQAKGTEPVYYYWHKVHDEHTFHFEDSQAAQETKKGFAFYAYRDDPTGRAHIAQEALERKRAIVPVYEWKHFFHIDTTFHPGDSWEGETAKSIAWYAHREEVRGAEPVYTFFNPSTYDHRVHMGEPAEGEEKHDRIFWAFRNKVEGTSPVYAFYNKCGSNTTYHFGEEPRGTWEQEKLGLQFWAYPEDPSAYDGVKLDIEKFMLRNITAKYRGLRFSVGDMHYDHFSDQFATHAVKDIVFFMMSTLGKSLVANIGLGAFTAPRSAAANDDHPHT